MKTRRLFAVLAALLTLTLGFTSPCGHAAPGDLDSLVADAAGNFVIASATQPDGKIILAGLFTSINGVPRNNVARINIDGTVDSSFDPNPNNRVNAVAVLPDGRILLAGFFTELQPAGSPTPTAIRYFARLNADGSLDPSFDLQPGEVGFDANGGFGYGLAVQADGRVLVWGNFTSLQSATHRGIARLKADGTLDAGFNPNPNGYVFGAAVQGDGKVLFGGLFSTLDPNEAGSPVARVNCARVNDNGTVDMDFDPHPSLRVFSLRQQADGKVLLSGDFESLQPNSEPAATPRNRIARVNSDGTVDLGFNPDASSEVGSVALQADGRIILVGGFETVQGNNLRYIARCTANGTPETSFNPNPVSGGGILGVTLQGDGSVQIAGAFTALQPNGAPAPTNRSFFARLQNDAATGSVSAPDAATAVWQRGGSAPEITGVLFERSLDNGATWTALGTGTRVGTTADWQITGLNLANTKGQLRALGFIAGGYFNGSSGLIRQTGNFDFDTVGGTTLTPTLTRPETNSLTHLNVTVEFDLKEAAKPGSVTLTFAAGANTPIVLTLGTSQEVAGPRSFELNPLQVLDATSGGAIAGSTATSIPDGSYIVTLSYQDTSSHDAATAMHTNVTLDNTLPALNLTPQFVAVDALGGATMPDVSGIATDLNGISFFNQNPAKDTPLPFGETFVNINATDGAGNPANGVLLVTVGYTRPTNPNIAPIAKTTDPLANVDTFGAAAPANSTLASFGPPAISDNRYLVARGTLLDGRKKLACIYEKDPLNVSGLVAFQGSSASGISGATFKSFLDPLISPDGQQVVFAGKVTGGGAKSSTDDGVWLAQLNTPSTVAGLLLREGNDMPGLPPNVKLKSVLGLSPRSDGVLTLVKLVRKPGLVTAADDTALVQVLGPASANLLLRTDQRITILPRPETKIKTITVLTPVLGSPGHGRWHTDGLILAKITLADKRTALVQFDNSTTLAVIAVTDGDAGGGAKWATFGPPSQCGEPGDVIALGTLAVQPGVVTKASDSAIGVSMGLGMFTAVQREGDDAPITDTKWVSFYDPVMNDYGLSAFLATIKGTGVTKANKTALWFGDAASPESIARLADPSSPVPDTAGNAVAGRIWAGITSYAIPYGPQSSLVFVAKVKGTGVTTASNTALYAIDTQNKLRELLRTNDQIGGKFVKSFTLLTAVPGAYGVARSTSPTGSVAALVTFTEKASQAIVRIDIP